MEKVVIFGTTELAVMCHFYLTHDSPYDVVAFTVDQDYIKEETLCNLPVVAFENIELSHPPNEYKILVAVWFGKVNKTRAEKYYQAKAKGYSLISYISSKSTICPGLVLGDNCIILGNCAIQPFVKLGNNITLLDGCVIGHHSIIKDHCFLSLHAVVSGEVILEPYCFLGANSTIRNNVVIASECVIGAGTLILENTRERGVYKGNPATFLPKPSNELKEI